MRATVLAETAPPIHLVDYGIHTAIVFHRSAIDSNYLSKIGDLGDFEQLEISFGEEPFFRRSEHTKMDIFKALFLPSESILRFHPFSDDPIAYFKEKASVAIMNLSEVEQKLLVAEIFNSLSNEHLPNQFVEVQFSKKRYFAKAVENYHILNNCNDWTARIFAKVGIETRLTSKFSSADLFDDIISRSGKGEKINFSNEKYLKYLR